MGQYTECAFAYIPDHGVHQGPRKWDLGVGWTYSEAQPLRACSKPTHMGSDQSPFVWALPCLPLLHNCTVPCPPLRA